MTDPLIDQLVGDLKPQDTLANWKLWMHCTACLAIVAAMILGFMGLRADYGIALQDGALFWKPGIFLLVWIGSVLLITDLSRPHGDLRKNHIIPLILAGGILIWQFSLQVNRFSWNEMLQSLSDGSAIYCLSIITGGGSIAMMMAWKYWFSKTASQYPVLLGSLAGLSAGSLAAAAYALHCDHDMAIYITIYYGVPVLVLSTIGAALGKKFLSW